LTDLIGYIAASLVFVTFCAKRMVPLRTLAIVSNICFISYGSLLELWPIVLLHSCMLPMNVVRLHQASAVPRGFKRWYQGPTTHAMVALIRSSAGPPVGATASG
jgi:CRP/FNR family transcriptional regulator, cyclic AMP receptor protein